MVVHHFVYLDFVDSLLRYCTPFVHCWTLLLHNSLELRQQKKVSQRGDEPPCTINVWKRERVRERETVPPASHIGPRRWRHHPWGRSAIQNFHLRVFPLLITRTEACLSDRKLTAPLWNWEDARRLKPGNSHVCLDSGWCFARPLCLILFLVQQGVSYSK